MENLYNFIPINDVHQVKEFIKQVNTDLLSSYRYAKESSALQIYGCYDPNDKKKDKNLVGIFICEEKGTGIANERTAEISQPIVKQFISQNSEVFLKSIFYWLRKRNFSEVLFIIDDIAIFENYSADLGIDRFKLLSMNHKLADMKKFNELITVKDDFDLISFEEFSQLHQKNYLELLATFIYTTLTTNEDPRDIICNLNTLKTTKAFIMNIMNNQEGSFLRNTSSIAIKNDKIVGVSLVTQEEDVVILPLMVIAQSHKKTLLFEIFLSHIAKKAQQKGCNEFYLALVAINPLLKNKALDLGFNRTISMTIYKKSL